MQKNFFNNNTLPANYLANENDGKFDLAEMLDTLVGGKWLILFITGLILALGIAKAFIDAPVYQADSLLQVDAQSQTLRLLEPGGMLQKNEVPVLAEVELINSRMVLNEAIKKLDLDIIARPQYFPVIGEAIARRFTKRNPEGTIAPPLFEQPKYAWGGEAIRVDSFTVPAPWLDKSFLLIAGKDGHFQLILKDETILEGEVGKLASNRQNTVTLFIPLLKARPGTQFTIMHLSENNAITQLKKRLHVEEKGRLTRILELTLEDNDPEVVVRILNEVVNIYIRQNVEQKSAEAQKTLEFLDKQMPFLKEQLATATAALNDYRTRMGSIDLDLETQGILDGVVRLKTEITQLQQQRDELRQKFTESHPSIVAIDKQISRLQSQMNIHDQKIEVLPETQQVIVKLEREVNVNTELYTALLNNAQTFRVAKAGTVADVRIIDYAILPTLPVKPKKGLIIAVSFMLGLFLGIIWVLVRQALRRCVEDPDLIEKKLHIPVYATIPHSDDQEKLNKKLKSNYTVKDGDSLILAVQNSDDLAIESLRSLRTTLHFAFLEAQNNIIMITGPSPGVGKSFVAINLAVVLANAGKKILLIDGDMRKGFINKAFGMDRGKGLSELISSSISESSKIDYVNGYGVRASELIININPDSFSLLDETIHSTPVVNLDFIATGHLPPNPSELLLHERFGELLTNISAHYDHVIIDSPPILAVTDATIIGRMASATLMVVKAGAHPMRELEQSVKILNQAGVQLKGVVFNDLPESSSRYQYGYGKYVYQYSYKKAS